MDDRLLRLLDLLDLLDVENEETTGTSVRLPTHLREATALATELGLIGSTTDVTVQGIRRVLDGVAQRAVLNAHYQEHPDARPDLAQIAIATAELDDHPLARRPELIRRAAEEVASLVDEPTPDDVLLFAAGLAAAA